MAALNLRSSAENLRRVWQFKHRDHTGEAHVLDIDGPEQLLAVLARHFGLHFPAGTRFELAPP